jgi:hypothetical protein
MKGWFVFTSIFLKDYFLSLSTLKINFTFFPSLIRGEAKIKLRSEKRVSNCLCGDTVL